MQTTSFKSGFFAFNERVTEITYSYEDFVREAERLEAERVNELSYIKERIASGTTTFKKEGQEAVLHLSSRSGFAYQLTIFDKAGALGHADFKQDATSNTIAEKVQEYGFLPCNSNELEFDFLKEQAFVADKKVLNIQSRKEVERSRKMQGKLR